MHDASITRTGRQWCTGQKHCITLLCHVQAVPQQQQWAPQLPVHRDEGIPQPQHFGGSAFDRQIAAAAAAEPPSAQSHATTTSAMDYNWEASVAALNVQQGLAAMAVHGSPSSDHQQDRQVDLHFRTAGIASR